MSVEQLKNEIENYRKINTANSLFNKFYGKYGLEQSIGMGSFGQVYKAIDYTKQRDTKKQMIEQKALAEALSKTLTTDKKTKRQYAKTLATLESEMVKKKVARTWVRRDERAVEILKEKKELDAKIAALEKKTQRINVQMRQIKERLGVLQPKLEERVAIKMLNMRLKRNKSELIDAEVEVMRKLDHDNIVRIYEYLKPHNWRFIVMEYCSAGDVYNLIIKKAGHVKDFARSMLSALRYLHEQNIIHNDIKPDNVVVHQTARGQYIYKLADFGTAVKIERPYDNIYCGFHSMSGTPEFFAPERFKDKTTAKSDIYALGVSMYWLLTGRDPKATPPKTHSFPEVSDSIRYVKIMNHEFMKNHNATLKFYDEDDARCDATTKDFILQLTRFDVRRRPTAAMLEHHPWLQQTDVVDDVPEYIQHRLIKYAGLSRMQKIVRRNIKGMLPADDIAAMRTLFEQVTHQRLFVLQEKWKLSEMQTFMDDFGIEADISAADINSNGEIDVDEFIAAVLAPWLWKTDYRADEFFSKLDADGNNKLDFGELATLTGESKDAETVALFDKIDTDHSGGISKGEFRTWIHHEEE